MASLHCSVRCVAADFESQHQLLGLRCIVVSLQLKVFIHASELVVEALDIAHILLRWLVEVARCCLIVDFITEENVIAITRSCLDWSHVSRHGVAIFVYLTPDFLVSSQLAIAAVQGLPGGARVVGSETESYSPAQALIEGVLRAEVAFKIGLLDVDLLVAHHHRRLKGSICEQDAQHDESEDDPAMGLQRAPIVLKHNLKLLRKGVQLLDLPAPLPLPFSIIYKVHAPSIHVCQQKLALITYQVGWQ